MNILHFSLKCYDLVILLIAENVSSNNSWLLTTKPMSGKILTVMIQKRFN